MKIKGVVCGVVCSLGSLSLLNAQLSWQNDVVIEGDLDVGTSTQKGNVRITGETGNQAGVALNVTGDGGVLFQGTAGTGTLPVVQGGPFFMWYPKKAAFLASSGSTVVDANIGVDSVALHGRAYGNQSFAFGSGWYAEGDRSISLGGEAVGINSFAAQTGYALGDYSWAIGVGEAYGIESIAFGDGIADGQGSIAFGHGSSYGESSIAFGGSSYTSSSMSLGIGSIAIGGAAQANAFNSVVIGAGTADGDPDEWVATDPQFVVGYGTAKRTDAANIRNKNALVVYKNGNISIPKRQGDILMGEFGLPE